MVEALLAGTLAAFSGVDIYGAHTSQTRGGCTGDYGKSCAYVVPEWNPSGDRARGGKLPFERSGRLTRIKLPLSGPTTIYVRVVRAAGTSTFRVRASSGPLRIRREGWLNVPLNLRFKAGDTIAIGVRGTEGPHAIHGGMSPGPNGAGGLLLAKGDSATRIRHANGLGGHDGELGYQGLSMVLTTR